jgi:hypothetical protein
MKDENPYVDRVCSKIQLRIYKSDCIYISTKVVFIKGEQQLQSINRITTKHIQESQSYERELQTYFDTNNNHVCLITHNSCTRAAKNRSQTFRHEKLCRLIYHNYHPNITPPNWELAVQILYFQATPNTRLQRKWTEVN